MSAGISISFKNQITNFAKASGIDLTPEGVDNLDTVLRSTMRVAEDQVSVSFVTGDGRTGSIEDALAIHTEGASRKSKSSAPAGTMTARAVAQNTANTPQARASEIVRSQGNPWAPRSISRTRQAVLVNLDPALASRLQKEVA